MGQTDGPVESLYAEKHQVLSETNANFGKTSPGEITAQFAFQAIKFRQPQKREENFEPESLSWEHGFGQLQTRDLLAKQIKDN